MRNWIIKPSSCCGNKLETVAGKLELTLGKVIHTNKLYPDAKGNLGEVFSFKPEFVDARVRTNPYDQIASRRTMTRSLSNISMHIT